MHCEKLNVKLIYCLTLFHSLNRYVQQEIQAIKQETNENNKIRHIEKEERQVIFLQL